MNIGVPKETAANERRVALTPDVAGRLVKAGFSVLVERGAGEAASFGDDAFGAVGATLVAIFFSSRRRHTRFSRDWSSDVCSSDLAAVAGGVPQALDVGIGPENRSTVRRPGTKARP